MVKDEHGNGGEDGAEPEHFRKLFIGGLTPNTTEDMMREFYGKWGEVVDVVVMRDPHTKRSRGFGFVTYAQKVQVDECQINRPHVIDGKTVDPKRAVPRDANSRGEANVSSKRLYVSGVREDHTEQMFQDHFSQFGTIEKVDIVTDKNTNKPRGFAFVTFTDYDSVDQCVLIKSHQINGYRCDVKKGLTKEEMAKAQQSERDRADRANRSRGGMGGGGGGGRGGYGGGMMSGGGGGAWAGQGWSAGGGGGYGRGAAAGGGGWSGDSRGGQAWGGYGQQQAAAGGYGGYAQQGQMAAQGGGGWGGDAWGQQGQGAQQQQTWSQPSQGQQAWGGAAAQQGYGGGGYGQGGRGY